MVRSRSLTERVPSYLRLMYRTYVANPDIPPRRLPSYSPSRRHVNAGRIAGMDESRDKPGVMRRLFCHRYAVPVYIAVTIPLLNALVNGRLDIWNAILFLGAGLIALGLLQSCPPAKPEDF